MSKDVHCAIIGGSGFEKALAEGEKVAIETPYGAPSAEITIADVMGYSVAFLPRHGYHHELLPHQVNFRANMWALKELGVTQIFGLSAAGSLREDYKPGDFVLTSDFVNNTSGRESTYFTDKIVHMHMEQPYCPRLRLKAAELGEMNEEITLHKQGTVVVVNGPRFSTKAESRSYIQLGYDLVNMTQFPECYLAKELDLCYCNIALITDYDIGVANVESYDWETIVKTFKENTGKLVSLLESLISKVGTDRSSCQCKDAVKNSTF